MKTAKCASCLKACDENELFIESVIDFMALGFSPHICIQCHQRGLSDEERRIMHERISSLTPIHRRNKRRA